MQSKNWLGWKLQEKIRKELELYGFKTLVFYTPNYNNGTPDGYSLFVGVGKQITDEPVPNTHTVGYNLNEKCVTKLLRDKRFRNSFLMDYLIPTIKKRLAEIRLHDIESDFLNPS